MSVSPGAQTLHGLSANHKPGFSASAALQSGAAETERDRGHWGRHTQVTCQRRGGPGLSLQRLWLWNIRILVILMVLEGCYVLQYGALLKKKIPWFSRPWAELELPNRRRLLVCVRITTQLLVVSHSGSQKGFHLKSAIGWRCRSRLRQSNQNRGSKGSRLGTEGHRFLLICGKKKNLSGDSFTKHLFAGEKIWDMQPKVPGARHRPEAWSPIPTEEEWSDDDSKCDRVFFNRFKTSEQNKYTDRLRRILLFSFLSVGFRGRRGEGKDGGEGFLPKISSSESLICKQTVKSLTAQSTNSREGKSTFYYNQESKTSVLFNSQCVLPVRLSV